MQPSSKSSYHYQGNIKSEAANNKKIDKQLKPNRRLLKNFNKAVNAFFGLDGLVAEVFNPNYLIINVKTKKEISTCSSMKMGS